MKKTKYLQDSLVHSYHRARSGNILFYSDEDRLVYFTIFMTRARNAGIRVFSLSLMFNHTHSLIAPGSVRQLEAFYSVVAKTYTQTVNQYAGLQGPLFEPFDWAVKKDGKAIRSCIIYIANNSVEKKLFRYAEQDRWSFLSYADNRFPFSQPIRLRTASRPLRRAVSLVKAQYNRGAFMNYAYLNRVFKGLSDREKEQVIDLIISTYSRIEFRKAGDFFEGFPSLLNAVHTGTGKEYDLSEAYERESDLPYREMCRYVAAQYGDLSKRLFLRKEHTEQLLPALIYHTCAPLWQIFRFLHLPWQISR